MKKNLLGLGNEIYIKPLVLSRWGNDWVLFYFYSDR